MYCHFGSKFVRLTAGPMWKVQESGHKPDVTDPMAALVNVPAVSDRTIQRNIENSSFSCGSVVQKAVLLQAQKRLPNSTWWIKGDATDVTEGLRESVQLQWSGDVDLNDGHIQHQYDMYQQRLKTCETFGLLDNGGSATAEQIITQALSILEELHQLFCADRLKTAKQAFDLQAQNSDRGVNMPKLAWDVAEFEQLQNKVEDLIADIKHVRQIMQNALSKAEANIPRQITAIRKRLRQFIIQVTRRKRISATHVFVFMISEEHRAAKPYAIPVQMFPYRSVKDRQLHGMVDRLRAEMLSVGMCVRGLVTDGEFNSLRTMGNKRPVSIIQLRSNARNKYARFNVATMTEMLSIARRDENGIVIAKRNNPAVLQSTLQKIARLMGEGMPHGQVC